MVELVVVLAIILVITGVALPSFLRAYRSYQLNDAATQLANEIKFTRYEAIRLNTATTINSLVRPGGTGGCPAVATRCIWTDSNGDLAMQATERQIRFTGNIDVVTAGTPPGTGNLAASVGAGALTPVSITTGSVPFDQRGAMTAAVVDVLYVGNQAFPNLGYRAVIVLPSGSVQIWSCPDSSGNWTQIN